MFSLILQTYVMLKTPSLVASAQVFRITGQVFGLVVTVSACHVGVLEFDTCLLVLTSLSC